MSKNSVELVDDSIMPIGKFKGKEMIEVPDSYLLWFWGENKQAYRAESYLNSNTRSIMEYIEDGFDEKRL